MSSNIKLGTMNIIPSSRRRVQKIIQNGQHYRCGAYAGANLVGISGCWSSGTPCGMNCSNCCNGYQTYQSSANLFINKCT